VPTCLSRDLDPIFGSLAYEETGTRHRELPTVLSTI
jgi:hypothetical protein